MVDNYLKGCIIYDIAIIGAGPTGLFSIFQAGMLGLKSCIIDTLGFLGGQCNALYPEKNIYDIPGFPSISAKQLINNLIKQNKPFNTEYYLDQRCNHVVKKSDYFEILTSRHLIKAKAVIIAAGGGNFEPRKPPIDNIGDYEGTSVFYHVENKTHKYRKLWLNLWILYGGHRDRFL